MSYDPEISQGIADWMAKQREIYTGSAARIRLCPECGGQIDLRYGRHGKVFFFTHPPMEGKCALELQRLAQGETPELANENFDQYRK